MGSWLPKISWGYICVSEMHVPELEKPLWLVSIMCLGAHAQELEKSLVIFVACLWTLLGMSGLGLRDKFEIFSSRPRLIAHAQISA